MMQIKICVVGTQWPQLLQPGREGLGERDSQRAAMYFLSSSSSPHPARSLPPLLLSPTSSVCPRDCVTTAQFQINRLQRVMKGRWGYGRWGSGRVGDLSFHDDSCSWKEPARGCVCVYVSGLHSGERPSLSFFFFFYICRNHHKSTLIRTTHTHPPGAHCCATYCFNSTLPSLSQPKKVWLGIAPQADKPLVSSKHKIFVVPGMESFHLDIHLICPFKFNNPAIFKQFNFFELKIQERRK